MMPERGDFANRNGISVSVFTFTAVFISAACDW
jgi:hypothetical protein